MQLQMAFVMAVTASPLLLGCGGNAGISSSTGGTLIVQGTAALSSFPFPISRIEAVQGGSSIGSAAVAPDGKFKLAIPRGSAIQLRFVGSAGGAQLVFPRPSGAIDMSFRVAGASRAPLEIGNVHYIGDARTRTYAFDPSGCAAAGSSGTICVVDRSAAALCGTGAAARGLADADGDGPDGDEGPSAGASASPLSQAVVAEQNVPAEVGCDQDGPDGDE
jgi:hypothetical protein